MENIPWVEKYRPTDFKDIVIDDLNKKIFKNILSTGYFPNLILYGPPGTGKTTTIINLIQSYQDIYSQRNKDLIIHLNASDERGIETIRNQIYDFVTSKCLFSNGMKFVILDEIDNMTKNAQFAFRYILLNNYTNVRFCLICNYISKIEKNLQNNFLKLKFNQLPKEHIILFIQNIIEKEKLILDKKIISSIQSFYGSDIRSMINFIQNNSEKINLTLTNNLSKEEYKKQYKETNKKFFIHFKKFKMVQIINNEEWDKFLHKINETKEPLKHVSVFIKYVHSLCSQYNIDTKTLVKLFLKYIILNKNISNTVLNDFEYIVHSDNINTDIYIQFFIIKLIQHSGLFHMD